MQGHFTNCSDEYITMSHEFSGVVEVVKLQKFCNILRVLLSIVFGDIFRSYNPSRYISGDSMSSLLWLWHGENILLPNLAMW
jgi:hypothetical protein